LELHEIYTPEGAVIWTVNEDASAEWIEDFRIDPTRHPPVETLTVPILYNGLQAFEAFRIGATRGTMMPMIIILDKQGVVRLRMDWFNIDYAMDIIEQLIYE